jgi:hypothetical protein
MTNTVLAPSPKPAGARPDTYRPPGTTASPSDRSPQIVGSIVAIVVNALLLYVAHNVHQWGVPFITSAWADALWAVDLSLKAAIVAQALRLSYDARWLRALCDVLEVTFAMQAVYHVWLVYPFSFGSDGADEAMRWMLLLLLVPMTIALVVGVVTSAVEIGRALVRAATAASP